MLKLFQKVISYSGIPVATRFLYSQSGSFVALFHGVHKKWYGLHPNAQRDLTILQLDQILQWLDKRFDFITPQQFFEGYKGGVLLTFDDGLANNYNNALSILEKYEAPALFFVSTQHILNTKNWLWFIQNRAKSQWENLPEDVPNEIAADLYDGMSEEELKALSAHPLTTIGAHTITHPKLTKCDVQKIEKELKEAKDYLEDLVNQNIQSFAYPQGLYNKEIIELVKKHYKYAFAVDSKYNRHESFEIPRISLHSDGKHYLNLKFSGLHKKPFYARQPY